MNAALPVSNRVRLDELLVLRGDFATRSRARDAIERGAVRVDGEVATKPGRSVAARNADPDRRPGAQLCFARSPQADRRPRPFPARSARPSCARHRRLDRRLHAGAAGARRRARHRNRCRARPARRRACGPTRASRRSRASTRAISSAGHLGAGQPGFPRLRRQLHLAETGAAARPRARGARRRRRPAGQAAIRGRPRGDRQGRPAARSRRRRRASPRSCAPGSTRSPAWRTLGFCPSPIEGGDGNREFLLAGIKDR